MHVEVGKIVQGKYRIERCLARGGMGSVWVARHLQLEVDVAVKFMDALLAVLPDLRVRFEREAKAAACLRSPYIVHVYDYGLEENLPFMVMELLKGEDLQVRLEREGRLPLDKTLVLLNQICKGLRRAHQEGIVHRDLKPSNVFLARDYEEEEETAKILDFGVAKMQRVASPGMTAVGIVLGSPSYMSPEQARGHLKVDHRADLWSAAVIAFRAIAGRLPFVSDANDGVLAKICEGPIPRPSDFAADLPTAIDVFFARALSRDPEARFQSAPELASAFAEALRGSGVAVRGALGLLDDGPAAGAIEDDPVPVEVPAATGLLESGAPSVPPPPPASAPPTVRLGSPGQAIAAKGGASPATAGAAGAERIPTNDPAPAGGTSAIGAVTLASAGAPRADGASATGVALGGVSADASGRGLRQPGRARRALLLSAAAIAVVLALGAAISWLRQRSASGGEGAHAKAPAQTDGTSAAGPAAGTASAAVTGTAAASSAIMGPHASSSAPAAAGTAPPVPSPPGAARPTGPAAPAPSDRGQTPGPSWGRPSPTQTSYLGTRPVPTSSSAPDRDDPYSGSRPVKADPYDP